MYGWRTWCSSDEKGEMKGLKVELAHPVRAHQGLTFTLKGGLGSNGVRPRLRLRPQSGLGATGGGSPHGGYLPSCVPPITTICSS